MEDVYEHVIKEMQEKGKEVFADETLSREDSRKEYYKVVKEILKEHFIVKPL